MVCTITAAVASVTHIPYTYPLILRCPFCIFNLDEFYTANAEHFLFCINYFVCYFVASLAKVDKQKESEEPTSDVTPDLSIDVPEAPSLAPTVPPYESTEYEESVTQLLNMIRDTSAACYPHWKELR